MSHVGKMELSAVLAQHAIIVAIQHEMQQAHSAAAISGQTEHYVPWEQRAISVKIQQLIGMVNWVQDAEMNQYGHEVPHVGKDQLVIIVAMERVDCMVTCV